MVKVRFANFNSFLSYSVSLYPNEKCLTDHWNPYVICIKIRFIRFSVLAVLSPRAVRIAEIKRPTTFAAKKKKNPQIR